MPNDQSKTEQVLTKAERAVIARDINNAQASLERVRRTATLRNDWRLAKRMGEQIKQLGETVIQIHETPPITAAELMLR